MNETWTIKKMLDWGTGYFEKNGIESPRLNIEHLLAEVLKKKNRIDLYVEFERTLTQEELQTLKASIQRRIKREPLQYILGYVDFSDSRFKVNTHVLIPRPETENIVEQLKTLIQQYFLEQSKIRILDLGTGSGCLGLSLCKAFLQTELTAVDISEEALELAKENAETLEIADRIRFVKGNWFEALNLNEIELFDLIVSNPPYVSEKEFEGLEPEVKDFEPRQALVSGESGLEMYEKLIPDSIPFLKEKGLLAFEVGLNQAEKVKTIMETNHFKPIDIYKDLNNIDRLITGIRL